MASDIPRSKTIPWTLSLLVILMGAVSCDEERPDQGPTEPPNLGEASSRRTPRRGRFRHDDKFAMIADELPGFAGVFFDSRQQLVVQLTDVGRLSEAKTKVREFFGQQSGNNMAISERYDELVSQMTARRATYDFRQLHTWREKITDEIVSLDATIVFTDIDETDNRVSVGVREEERVGSVAAQLEKLGVPRDALNVQHAPGNLVPTASLQGTVRPVIAGVQIRQGGPSHECSLGFNVNHSNSNYWYFVTASHCTSELGVSNGDTFGQPTESSAIGTEVADSPRFDHDDDEDCPDDGRDCVYSDAALIRYTTSSWTHGKIAWPADTGTTTYTNTTDILADGVAIESLFVQKVGRSTGRTYGFVTDVDRDGWLVLSAIDSVWVMGHSEASYRASGGDSGGPVVWYLWGSAVSLGIHFATNSVTGASAFIPASAWRSDLGEEVNGTLYTDIGHSPPPSVTITGPTTVHPDWYCEWHASGSGGVPPYSYTWSGVLSGTNSSIWGNVSSSGDLRVTVKDDVEHTGTDYLYITVSESAPYHPNCSEEDDDKDNDKDS